MINDTIETLRSIKNQLETEYAKLNGEGNEEALDHFEKAITEIRRTIIALLVEK